MIRIGLTGGIGAGKSVVSNILRHLEYPVYDSDSEAKHLMLTSEEIKTQLVNTYGEEVYQNGILNKKYLSQIIFSSVIERQRVNNIVHPVVCADFIEWSQRQKGNICFVESAILYECDLQDRVDAVWFVDAPVDIRLSRAMKRDNAQRQVVEQRVNAQNEIVEYAHKHADAIIINDGSHLILPQINHLLLQVLSIKG